MKPQGFLLLCLSSRFMTYTPSFILGRLSLEKNAIKRGFVIEILSNLDIAQRMEWNQKFLSI